MIAFVAVLVAWLAVFPLTPFHSDVLWSAHLFAVAAAALALVPRLWRTSRLTVGPPALCLAVMGLSMLLAMVVTRDVNPGREMSWIALTGVAHAAFFLACLFAAPGPVVGGAEQDDAAVSRWRGALVVLLLVVLVGQLATMLLAEPQDEGSWRPSGTLGNPNALGTVLAAGGLVLVALARFRPTAMVLSIPLLIALLATRSRGAVASLGVVLAVLLWQRYRGRALALFAVLALALVLVPNPLRDRVEAMQPEHAFSRTFIWARAVDNVVGAPLGIGPGMNKYVFPVTAWDAEHPWLLHQRHAVGLTHNVFLTVTLEWGWLAGLALVTLTIWSARRMAARGPPDPLRLAAMLGAVVLFVELQVDGLEQQPTAFGLFLLLAATALARSPLPVRGLTVSGRLVAVAAVILAAGLLVPAAQRILVNDAFRRLEPLVEAHEEGQLELAELRAAFESVTAIAPTVARPWRRWLRFEKRRLESRLGQANPDELSADAEIARRVLAAARAANPRDRLILRQGAELHRRLFHADAEEGGGDPADLQAYFELTAALLAADPLDVEVRFALASEAHRVGQTRLRDEALEVVFGLEPDYAWAWYMVARFHESENRPEQSLYAYVRTLEAYGNCALKIKVDSPRSRAFYERNLARVDPARVWRRIAELRREVYF